MIKEIRHVGFVVKDITRALEFYVGFLGFYLYDTGHLTTMEALDLLNVSTGLTYYKVRHSVGYNQISLEFYVLDFPPSENNTQILNHISLTVDDIDCYYEEMKKRAALISNRVFEINKHELFFGKDPDGNRIEFVRPMKV